MRAENTAKKITAERSCQQSVECKIDAVAVNHRDRNSCPARHNQNELDPATECQPSRIRKQQREVLGPALPHLRKAAIHAGPGGVRQTEVQLVSSVFHLLRQLDIFKDRLSYRGVPPDSVIGVTPDEQIL